MVSSIYTAVLLSTLFTTILASPTKRTATPTIRKRWEEGVDCTWSTVDAPAGLLFAADSEGQGISCDELEYATTEAGAKCYITAGDNKLGKHAKCPYDTAPTRNPDGSDADKVKDGLIDTWCNSGASLPGAAGEFASVAGCLMWGFYEGEGDPVAEAEAGAKGLCDALSAGICTWFMDISGELASDMPAPCVEDPDSIACTFGGPAK